MSTSEIRAALDRAVERFSAGDLEGYLRIYDANVVLHGFPPGLPPGIEGARQFYHGVFAGLSDLRLAILDSVTEGDRIAARFALTATHAGEFLGVPATGRQVTIQGITVLRFASGRCVERWNVADFLGLMQQLGVVPAPAATRA